MKLIKSRLPLEALERIESRRFDELEGEKAKPDRYCNHDEYGSSGYHLSIRRKYENLNSKKIYDPRAASRNSIKNKPDLKKYQTELKRAA